MEQAVNTFQKGLNVDSHPMAQGNDSLTDALNATFVTMNGNEIILLNDMGNRRIDNAFLPSGYLPVGMKEYGGIIYIAAYNPITNKSQIGSFPSPERKLSVIDRNFLPVTINNWIEEFISSNNTIDKDFILKPLTLLSNKSEYLSVHPGDKFTVYSDISLDLNLISNYHNIDEEKNIVKSPKNKLFTLSIGVLNSLNEFVDITSSLERWRNGEIYEFTNKDSLLYKFNYGYFIPVQKNNSYGTLDDLNFNIARESIEANTYSYKLIGPLYLKILLNHINKFNYIITGKNGEYLKIKYIVDYNCPDYGEENLDPIDLYANISTLNNITESFINLHILDLDITPSSVELINSSYNIEKNTYYVEYVCTYNQNIFNYVDQNTNILHISLNPKVKFNNEDYYIKDLIVEEDINVTLLNSNTIDIKEWRFTNDASNKKSTLTYSFECYPDEDVEFNNLLIRFFRVDSEGNITQESKIKLIDEIIYSGRNTIELDWDEIGLDSKALYKVDLLYDKIIKYKKGTPLKNLSIVIPENVNGRRVHLKATTNMDASVLIGNYLWIASLVITNNNVLLESPIEILELYKHTKECFINLPITQGTAINQVRITCRATDVYNKTASLTITFKYQYTQHNNVINISNISRSNKDTDAIISEANITLLESENYWFLTTELLNDFYYLSSEEFVPNFCTARNNNNYTKFKESFIIKPNLSINYEIISDKSEYIGGLIMENDGENKIKYTRTQNIKLLVLGNNIISDIYPDCIYLDKIINLGDLTVKYLDSLDDLEDDSEDESGGESGDEQGGSTSGGDNTEGDILQIYKKQLTSLGAPLTPEPTNANEIPAEWSSTLPDSFGNPKYFTLWISSGRLQPQSNMYEWEKPIRYTPNKNNITSPLNTVRDKYVDLNPFEEDFGGSSGGGTSSSDNQTTSHTESNNKENYNTQDIKYEGDIELSIKDDYTISQYAESPQYTNGFGSFNDGDISDKIHGYFLIGIGFLNRSSNKDNEHVLTLKITDNINNSSHESSWSDYSGASADNLIVDIELVRTSKDGIVRFNLLDNMDVISSYADDNHILYKGFGYCNFMSKDEAKAYHLEFTVGSPKITFKDTDKNSKTNTRLWLKGVDGQLALILDSLTSVFTSSDIETIKSKLEKLVYLTNNSGTFSNDFIISDIVTDLPYKSYVLLYNFEVNNEESIIHNKSYYINNNEETLFETPDTIESLLDITIDNQPFLDYLFNYRPNNIRNIWLENGSFVDSEGNLLDPQSVYINKDGKLVKVNLPLRYSSNIKLDNNKNALLFYGSNKAYIRDRYDTVGTDQDDSKTYLDYSGINVLDLTNI